MEQREQSVQVVCPKCDTKLLVKNVTGASERVVNCPKCQQSFTVSFVPAPQLAPSAPVAEPVSSSQPQKRGGASSSKGLLIGVLSGLVVVLAGLLVWLLVLKDKPSSIHAEETIEKTYSQDRQTSEPPEASMSVPKESESNNVSEPKYESKMYTVCGVSFTMIWVKGGTFTMGATSEQEPDAETNEKPAHQVTLSSFYIGENEVTQALWSAVIGSNPSKFKGSNYPVEMVSWDDCQEFVHKLNALTGESFMLPTEAQWEYAARGGVCNHNFKFSGSYNLSDVAWCYLNSNNSTHSVATRLPNELGIYDMSGNVWEWCQDRYGTYSSSSQLNPTGPSVGTNRIHRGGSWRYDPGICRVSDRGDCRPSDRYYNVGLRLAL